jgi:hypothetical protein
VSTHAENRPTSQEHGQAGLVKADPSSPPEVREEALEPPSDHSVEIRVQTPPVQPAPPPPVAPQPSAPLRASQLESEKGRRRRAFQLRWFRSADLEARGFERRRVGSRAPRRPRGVPDRARMDLRAHVVPVLGYLARPIPANTSRVAEAETRGAPASRDDRGHSRWESVAANQRSVLSPALVGNYEDGDQTRRPRCPSRQFLAVVAARRAGVSRDQVVYRWLANPACLLSSQDGARSLVARRSAHPAGRLSPRDSPGDRGGARARHGSSAATQLGRQAVTFAQQAVSVLTVA